LCKVFEELRLFGAGFSARETLHASPTIGCWNWNFLGTGDAVPEAGLRQDQGPCPSFDQLNCVITSNNRLKKEHVKTTKNG